MKFIEIMLLLFFLYSIGFFNAKAKDDVDYELDNRMHKVHQAMEEAEDSGNEDKAYELEEKLEQNGYSRESW